MFVAAEVLLDLGFRAAEARLANVARGGLLTPVSEGAYGDGLTGLARVGPLGEVQGVSKLVEVHVLDMVTRGESAVLALRWEATGRGARLFPAPGCRHLSDPRRGACRPVIAGRGATGRRWCPGRGPGQGGLHRVADATVRSLLARVADVLARPPESTGAVQRTDITRDARAGRRPGNALARLPSRRRIRLMVIEHDVPDIPDRQVQLVDGVLDLPGFRMVAHPPQCRFESEPREEQPVQHEVVDVPAAMRS